MSKGTNRAAIEYANEQIRQYVVGNFINVQVHTGGDDPPVIETIYRIKEIQLGTLGWFSVYPPVFIVENIYSGEESNLIKYVEQSFSFSASVWPFAFYNDRTERYDGINKMVNIRKLDKVEIKAALNSAILEKRRRQKLQMLEEMQRKERERQIAERQKQNESIKEEELLDLIDQLRK